MEKNENIRFSNSVHFPPVAAVLGHVDHGKTSLLDAIRKTDIAEKEHGGITQKIGASTVEILHENEKRRITFIDTPGHETFSQMRSRGAQVADIGLLIISSVDGLMPQTKESISLLERSKSPFIVVLTKMDVESKNPEKVKQQLLKEGILLEGYGGGIPVIEVSARSGYHIKELLELIVLVYDLHDISSSYSKEAPLKAIVIESKLDQRVGPKASVIVKNGTLYTRDEIVCEGILGKVKTLLNDKTQQVQHASVGEAVEILGFEKVPPVGGIVMIGKRGEILPQKVTSHPLAKEENVLSIILCADALGSLEAIVGALPKAIAIVEQKSGEITPADVLLAKSTGAIIVGFNVKVKSEVLKMAKTEKVILKVYTIIYKLLEEISEALEGKQLVVEEEILGKAKVLASFPFEKTKVLGVQVLEGRIAKGDRVKLVRDGEEIGQSVLSSLRQGKDVVSKSEAGNKAGAIVSPFLDFIIDDVLLCYR